MKKALALCVNRLEIHMYFPPSLKRQIFRRICHEAFEMETAERRCEMNGAWMEWNYYSHHICPIMCTINPVAEQIPKAVRVAFEQALYYSPWCLGDKWRFRYDYPTGGEILRNYYDLLAAARIFKRRNYGKKKKKRRFHL